MSQCVQLNRTFLIFLAHRWRAYNEWWIVAVCPSVRLSQSVLWPRQVPFLPVCGQRPIIKYLENVVFELFHCSEHTTRSSHFVFLLIYLFLTYVYFVHFSASAPKSVLTKSVLLRMLLAVDMVIFIAYLLPSDTFVCISSFSNYFVDSVTRETRANTTLTTLPYKISSYLFATTRHLLITFGVIGVKFVLKSKASR